MNKQRVPNTPDSFNKGANVYRYDNNSDELLMYCLELYPNESARFFGKDNETKKKILQAKLRDALNQANQEEMLNASGGRKRRGAVGRAIARAALVVPRGAALALIRLNFRGLAKRFSLLNTKGKENLEKKWADLGGKADKLRDAIKAGKDKKIIVCGKKCRSKAGANPSVNVSETFVNSTGADVAALVASGMGVIAPLASAVANNKNYKNQQELMRLEADLKQQQNQENAIDATMTPQEQKLADEIIKAQNSGADPIVAIQNNPNLTAEEKAQAIKNLQGMGGGVDNKKKIIIGGIVVAVLALVGYYLYTKKSNNS